MIIKHLLPTIPDYELPFWEGAKQHQLLLQRCARCEILRFLFSPICPTCLSEDAVWERASGRGRIHSFITYHQAFHPSFAKAVPYVVAFIALDEGPHLTANVLEVEPGQVYVGMPVEVVFEPLNDDITLPQFRPFYGPQLPGTAKRELGSSQ